MKLTFRAALLAAGLWLWLAAGAPAQTENYTVYLVETKTPNGQPLDGPVRLLRPNRTLVGEGKVVAGRLEGEWRGFLEKGGQIASVTFHGDALDGPVTIFHDPAPGSGAKVGLPSLTATVRKGGTRFEGTVTSYRADGSKLCERVFDAGGNLTSAQGWKEGGVALGEAEARRLADKLSQADFKILGILQTIFRSGTREGRRIPPTIE